jgi:hypothetical protein
LLSTTYTCCTRSLAARAFDPECIKALHAGDDCEPSVAVSRSRLACYRTTVRLFKPSEVRVATFNDLFRSTVPLEVVGCELRNCKRFGVMLKRASRNDFEVVAMKSHGETGVRFLLRRCNGHGKWASVCDDDVEIVERDSLEAWIDATWGASWGGVKAALAVKGVTGDDDEDGVKGDGACPKQEGGVDGFEGGTFDRGLVNLVETTCLILTPDLIGGGGLSKAIDVVTKNGFDIVAIRLISFGLERARGLFKAKGGLKGSRDGEWIERLGDGVSCVIAVQSDNALVRISKLLNEAASGGGGGGGGGRRGGSGSENLVQEDGVVGVLTSENGKAAGSDLCYCFGSLSGQATIVYEEN